MTSITPFLWFDNNVPEAVAFYKSVFPNAKVETVNDFMASFELEGQKFNALNGGPKYKFNEAISFFISVESQEEVDYFWNRLIADGGEESKCGWLKDSCASPFGPAILVTQEPTRTFAVQFCCDAQQTPQTMW